MVRRADVMRMVHQDFLMHNKKSHPAKVLQRWFYRGSIMGIRYAAPKPAQSPMAVVVVVCSDDRLLHVFYLEGYFGIYTIRDDPVVFHIGIEMLHINGFDVLDRLGGLCQCLVYRIIKTFFRAGDHFNYFYNSHIIQIYRLMEWAFCPTINLMGSKMMPKIPNSVRI
jgi:hypothetical protein